MKQDVLRECSGSGHLGTWPRIGEGPAKSGAPLNWNDSDPAAYARTLSRRKWFLVR